MTLSVMSNGLIDGIFAPPLFHDARQGSEMNVAAFNTCFFPAVFRIVS